MHLILVVHADTAHARPMERLLEAAGYEVVSAGEMDDIVALERRGHPDLVVVRDEDLDAVPSEIKQGKIPVVVVGRDERAIDGWMHCQLQDLVETISKHFQSMPSQAR